MFAVAATPIHRNLILCPLHMYSHSQFDGNAAFSGGGFMPSQATQTAEPAFSPARVCFLSSSSSIWGFCFFYSLFGSWKEKKRGVERKRQFESYIGRRGKIKEGMRSDSCVRLGFVRC